jgi:hypothetical protein
MIARKRIMELFVPTRLKDKVTEWRNRDYSCDYSAISEIFDYNLM